MAKTITTTQTKILEGRFGKQIPQATPKPPQTIKVTKSTSSK